MTRYRPVMIDGVAGFSLRRGANAPPPEPPPPRFIAPPPAAMPDAPVPAAEAATRPDAPEPDDPVAQTRAGLARRVTGEPDPATATLDDWRAWRARLLALSREDVSVRIALRLAEAQIAKLRARLR